MHSSKASRLRVVILDYPQLQIHDPQAMKFLSDAMTGRQIGYQKASPTYVAIDKLDMIGTHVLVYDTSDFFNPRVITGLRLSHSDRCATHQIELPMDQNISHASLETQKAYNEFKRRHGVVVESNGWFVDSEFSFDKSGMDIGRVIFGAMATYQIRMERDHFTTATNERFKASRRVKFGHFEEGHVFVHPAMPDPHKVLMINSFDKVWLKESYDAYPELLWNRVESVPKDMTLKDFAQTVDDIYAESLSGDRKVS